MTLTEFLDGRTKMVKSIEYEIGVSPSTIRTIAKGTRTCSLRVALQIERASAGAVLAESLLRDPRDFEVLEYVRGK